MAMFLNWSGRIRKADDSEVQANICHVTYDLRWVTSAEYPELQK